MQGRKNKIKKKEYFFRLLINYFILGNILIKKLTKTVKINAKPKTKHRREWEMGEGARI